MLNNNVNLEAHPATGAPRRFARGTGTAIHLWLVAPRGGGNLDPPVKTESQNPSKRSVVEELHTQNPN